MKDIDMNRVHLSWCMDIMKRIKEIVEDKKMEPESKLTAIKWYAKQGLKVERED